MLKSAIMAAAMLVAVPALAQEAPDNFNGPFVGIQGGWQQDRQALVQNGMTGANTKADGFAYGGQAGYDFRMGANVVLGAEVSLTGRTGKANYANFDYTQGRTINANARLGYLIMPRGLVYARGGYSNARFTLEDSFGRGSYNRGGYMIGAGYEQILSRNISARLEYGYSDFGSKVFFTSSLTNLDYSRHAVMAGVNYRF